MVPLEHNFNDFHAIPTQVFSVAQGSPEESVECPQAGTDSEPPKQWKGRNEEQRFEWHPPKKGRKTQHGTVRLLSDLDVKAPVKRTIISL